VYATARKRQPRGKMRGPLPTERTGARRASKSGSRRLQTVPQDASLRTWAAAMPPPLRGTFQSLARQNSKSNAEGLERIEDDNDLENRIARKALVPVPVSAKLAINGNLPEDYRYCRPWTARFLADLARLHAAIFHRPLEVSSAVRTVAYQKRLMETNGNAAAAEGDIVSPHLTGATVDIAKNGLSRKELAWMRSTLLALQQAGKIDVEEEFQQACFHITVYKSYAPSRPARGVTKPKTEENAAGHRKTGRRTAEPPSRDEASGIASEGL
jgi:hypothetical protein